MAWHRIFKRVGWKSFIDSIHTGRTVRTLTACPELAEKAACGQTRLQCFGAGGARTARDERPRRVAGKSFACSSLSPMMPSWAVMKTMAAHDTA